ncbi:MAG TPA: ABC transporter permease [Stellaceae bacterium]|nr:ABC transporter permease [Stellaceae bacterium]
MSESPEKRLFRDPAALAAGVVLGAIVAGAILAPWLAPHDPYATSRQALLPPMWELRGKPSFPLGTDGQGRDLLSRLLFGTRITLMIGLVSVTLGGALGMAVGMLAAFYRRLDAPLMRLVDVVLSFPAILFGLAFSAVFGAGLTPVVAALVIATVPDTARITRGVALGIARQDYMEGGRAIGLGDLTLLRRYLARNCLPSVFVFLTLRFGQVVLLGAGLSFLGLGVRPPTAELGMMASQGRDFLFLAPHVATIPSLAIFVIVLAANLLGDALRDALDPRLRS